MKYIPKREQVLYETHFSDKLLSVEWKESELENDDLQNYKMKSAFIFDNTKIILQLPNCEEIFH